MFVMNYTTVDDIPPKTEIRYVGRKKYIVNKISDTKSLIILLNSLIMDNKEVLGKPSISDLTEEQLTNIVRMSYEKTLEFIIIGGDIYISTPTDKNKIIGSF